VSRSSQLFSIRKAFLTQGIPDSGPGGVEASFDWRAGFDEAAGTLLRASLLNDVSSYS
jgi:hypothetical protein